MNTTKTHLWITAIALTGLGILSRLLSHSPNFTALGGITLVSAIYLPRKTAISITFIAMAFSDFIIGFYHWPIMLSVYLSFFLTIFIGASIKKSKMYSKIFGGTILCALLFFLITNGAVWFFGTLYSHNFQGLIESYYMALPFLKNSLLGDLGYTFLLVFSFEVFLLRDLAVSSPTTSTIESPLNVSSTIK